MVEPANLAAEVTVVRLSPSRANILLVCTAFAAALRALFDFSTSDELLIILLLLFLTGLLRSILVWLLRLANSAATSSSPSYLPPPALDCIPEFKTRLLTLRSFSCSFTIASPSSPDTVLPLRLRPLFSSLPVGINDVIVAARDRRLPGLPTL